MSSFNREKKKKRSKSYPVSRKVTVIDRERDTYKTFDSVAIAKRVLEVEFNDYDNPATRAKECAGGKYAIQIEGRENIYFKRELEAMKKRGVVDSTGRAEMRPIRESDLKYMFSKKQLDEMFTKEESDRISPVGEINVEHHISDEQWLEIMSTLDTLDKKHKAEGTTPKIPNNKEIRDSIDQNEEALREKKEQILKRNPEKVKEHNSNNSKLELAIKEREEKIVSLQKEIQSLRMAEDILNK